jgi:multidrug efflux pump subunit AcrA (membrane-fusion protein)
MNSLVPYLLLVMACSPQETAPSEEPPSKPVGIAPAEPPKPLEFIAVVTSKQSHTITAEFDSTIKSINVNNNQVVKAGQVIIELDTEALQIKLHEAEGRKQAAQGQAGEAYAQARSAQHALRLEERLERTGAAPREVVRQKEGEFESASARGAGAAGQLKQAQSTIDDIERQLAHAKVTSPIDGVISLLKDAETGGAVRSGTQLARVFDPTKLEVEIAVPHSVKKDVVTKGVVVELEFDKGAKARATVTNVADDHDHNVDFSIAEAEFEAASLTRSDEIHAGAEGHARIADKGATR